MCAFAANSVLNRLGVGVYGTDPVVFAVVRTCVGAVVLAALVLMRGGPGGFTRPDPRRWAGAGALALYMAGFSLAYLTLDAGVGALILFGGVQLTMFAGAALGGEQPGRWKLIGAAMALAGLVSLAAPTGDVVLSPAGVALMLLAALGWGIYSLLGRGESDPLVSTAANFALCVPLVLPLVLLADPVWTVAGLVYAALAGGVTSALGYALWYSVVPQLGAGRAAVAQLSVPIIAALGGALLLDETVGWRFAVSAALVIGGIALSLRRDA